jgi:hypothetical protein
MTAQSAYAAFVQFCGTFAQLKTKAHDLQARTTGSVFHHEAHDLAESFARAQQQLDALQAGISPPPDAATQSTVPESGQPSTSTAAPAAS